MMLSIANGAPNLWLFSLPRQKQTQNRTNSHNGLIFSDPSSTTPLAFSFNSHESAPSCKPSRLLVDTNSEIRKLCGLGNLKNAVDLLLRRRNLELELRTYCSVLQLCADLKSLEDGRQVHALINANGIKIEGVLGSKLVFMYVKCGDLRQGRQIFDMISNDKVILWNILLSEYTKLHDFQESILLYRRMRELGIEADSYTFSCVLKCFAAIRSETEGEAVHGCLLKLGFGSCTAVLNSLIAYYFKCGRIECAHQVFDEMRQRDVISWNSMISGCASNGLADAALHVFIQMLQSGIGIDVATIVCAVAACANMGKELHARSIKSGFVADLTVGNTLLGMYSKRGDLAGAVRVFETMDERSVVSWTTMISGYAQQGSYDEAIGLFHEMVRRGLRPDAHTVTVTLHACAHPGSPENGKLVHQYAADNNMQSSLFVSNALMDMYAKCGSIEDAWLVFTQMNERDVVSWNTMIGGYSKNGRPNEALALLVEMQTAESTPDSRTMACSLPACASLAALDRGREIHGQVLRRGFFSDRHVANALVDMYVKCGVLAPARRLFDAIPSKDLVSWTVMIAGYGMHGLGERAAVTFSEMRAAGIVPDGVSFISILYACSHSGLVSEGWEFFNAMTRECGIRPTAEHYACLVDLLARAGDLGGAHRVIQRMPMEADGAIWGSLLRGCRTHRDVKLAETVAEHVFRLEPGNTGYYVLLANIYAEAEKWEEVKKLREEIGGRRLKKTPGCSWIEIRGKVHVFVTGDGSHPQAKRIRSMVNKWRGEMRSARPAAMDDAEAEKEATLCGHSEKLAMALGILSLPPGRTVRVAKNLRVCGDCHETAKFVSRKAGRVIVFRDANRFHHFKEGRCSCRGRW